MGIKKFLEMIMVFILGVVAVFAVWRISNNFSHIENVMSAPVSEMESQSQDLSNKSKSNQTPASQRASDARKSVELKQKADHDSHERARILKVYGGKYGAAAIASVLVIVLMIGETDDGPIYTSNS